jgi:hypothetical protein
MFSLTANTVLNQKSPQEGPYYQVLGYTVLKHYKIKGYLLTCWRVCDILCTFVPGPKHPLANKLFDMFGVNHGVEPLWPIPWHVA